MFRSVDPLYWLLIIFSMVLGMGTQAYIKSTYKKWSQVPSKLGQTGAQMARRMLDEGGANACGISRIEGTLTDNFDPSNNCLHLSPDNYTGGSVASVAVACHEAGHAVQTAQGYVFGRMRTALVPVVNFAQSTWMFVFFAGVVFNMVGLMQVSIVLFACSVLFQLVTLPVEIDASSRALKFLKSTGSELDHKGAKQVLTAAALTYVAGALVSLVNLLYLLARTQRR